MVASSSSTLEDEEEDNDAGGQAPDTAMQETGEAIELSEEEKEQASDASSDVDMSKAIGVAQPAPSKRAAEDAVTPAAKKVHLCCSVTHPASLPLNPSSS